MNADVTCPGCGLSHPSHPAPSPADRRITGECAAEAEPMLAEFYQPDLFSYRQYVVDAFACQHPESSTRRGIQATALCLMTMDLYFECGHDVALGAQLHQEMMRSHPDIFFVLDAPDLTGALTHRHVSSAESRDLYPVRAREWAHSVWEAWTAHHEQIREWNVRTVPHRVT